MALLQITEPGWSTAPHQRRLAVGIDLGTTHSLVAAVQSGTSDVLLDEYGEALLPSVVQYHADATVTVGANARLHQSDDPRNTIVSVKRFMGRGRQDLPDAARLPYRFADGIEARGAVQGSTGCAFADGIEARGAVQGSTGCAFADGIDDCMDAGGRATQGAVAEARGAVQGSTGCAFADAPGMVQFDTVAGRKSPVEVSAEILKSLRERAERALGGELIGAVITVPAYFDDAQRQATKDAARLSGLNVLRLLNEPTAAAIAYGLDKGAEGVYAIYDLGGGTFDISILRLTRGIFEVLATNGDSALGGDDFDHCIVQWILTQGRLTELGPRDIRRLLSAARAAKEALSTQSETRIAAILTNGVALDIMLTRAVFDALTHELVQKTLAPVRKALRDSKLRPADLDGVVLVGGSTRVPAVRAAVAGFFGQPPLTDLDPDQVVALGAAIQADALAGNRSDEWLLLDVIPLSLGLETMGGLTEKIIPRNSTIPVARAQDFTTYKDGQTALLVHVLQGERETVEHCRSLARFELRGFPPMAAGNARVRVTFQVDADGLLTVSACESRTGIEATVAVKPSYGLGDDEIARMLAESQSHAREDAEARAWREQQVEGRQLLDVTLAALVADGDRLLNDAERAAIQAALDQLHVALDGTDRAALRTACEQLNRASSEFAARRMDSAVRAALAGQRLTELET
jgi:molecular chaperone HscA